MVGEQIKHWAECNNCGVLKLHMTYEQVDEFSKAHADCRKQIQKSGNITTNDDKKVIEQVDEGEELYN